MSLLDIASAIDAIKDEPGVYECEEACKYFLSSPGAITLVMGDFVFERCGRILQGTGSRGKTIYTTNKVCIVKWENKNTYSVYEPYGEGLHIKNAELCGRICNVTHLENSDITGTVHVMNEHLVIAGSNSIRGRVATSKPNMNFVGREKGPNELIIYPVNKPDVEMQPLVGPSTFDNMSYGRWSPVDESAVLSTVSVRNAIIQIKSDSPFTCGSYGYEKVPDFDIEDGSAFLCTERAGGTRVMVRRPVAPPGSTKISGKCVYAISYKEDFSDVPLSDYAKEIVNGIKELNPEVASKVTAFVPEKNLLAIEELLCLDSKMNVSLLLQPRSFRNYASAQACCVLGIDFQQYNDNEFFWYLNKCKALLKDAGYNESELDKMEGYAPALAKIAREKFGTSVEEFTALEKRYVYDMIPEYEFDFAGKDISVCIKEFLAIQ